jgi:hypothetical protein
MRIAAILLIALLLAGIGGAAFFYTQLYQPLDEKMRTSIPEFDKTKAELMKYKSKERTETLWATSLIEAVNAELGEEIKTGAVEVLFTGARVVVNIAEQALYVPESRTFAKESPRMLMKLETLLRSERIKGKDIYIGNATETVPAQTRGRIRSPQKDGRTLAADRSMELIKYLEKKGVTANALIALAYVSGEQTLGAAIKNRKTVILVETPPSALVVTGAKQASPAEPPRTAPATTAMSAATVTSATSTTAPVPTMNSAATATTMTTKPSISAAAGPMQTRPTTTVPTGQKTN